MGYAGVPKAGEDENCCSFAARVGAGVNTGGGSLGVATDSSIASIQEVNERAI